MSCGRTSDKVQTGHVKVNHSVVDVMALEAPAVLLQSRREALQVMA